MKTPSEVVKVAVSQHRNPSINDLLSEDGSGFDGTKLLLSKLLSSSVESKRNGSQTLFYVNGMPQPVLEIDMKDDGSFTASGPYLATVEAMLRAARIHEVESFEWIHLPWEQRAALVEAEAMKVKLSPEDFKALMSKWVN